jgi:hypothetical protein
MKYDLFYIRPEFLKKITGEPPRETIRRPDHRIVSVSLTINSPCI